MIELVVPGTSLTLYEDTRNIIMVLIPLVYIIPTIVMQCKLIWIFLRLDSRSKFRFGFYRLVCIGLINDLICLMADITGNRLGFLNAATGYHNFIRKHGTLAEIIFFLTEYTYVNQAFNAFLISCNRLSVVFFPLGHTSFWEKYTDLCTVIFILYPFLYVWVVPYCDIYYVTSAYIGYHLAGMQCMFLPKIDTLTAYNQLGFTFLNVIINTVVIVKLILQRNDNYVVGDIQKKRKAEIKLSVYTAILVSSQTAFSGASLYIQAQNTDSSNVSEQLFMLLWMQYVIDTTALCTTWCLVGMSSTVRKNVLSWRYASTTAAISHHGPKSTNKVTAPRS